MAYHKWLVERWNGIQIFRLHGVSGKIVVHFDRCGKWFCNYKRIGSALKWTELKWNEMNWIKFIKCINRQIPSIFHPIWEITSDSGVPSFLFYFCFHCCYNEHSRTPSHHRCVHIHSRSFNDLFIGHRVPFPFENEPIPFSI